MDTLVTPTIALNSTNALMERLWLSTVRQLFSGTKVRETDYYFFLSNSKQGENLELYIIVRLCEVCALLYYALQRRLYTVENRANNIPAYLLRISGIS